MAKRAGDKALVTFAPGLWSPEMGERVDLEKAQGALRRCDNFIVEPYGSLRRRPGMQKMAPVRGYDTPSGGTCPALGVQWYENVVARGGTANTADRQLICALSEQLLAKDYFSSIWLYCPFVGRDLNAALTPLINRLADDVGEPEGSFRLYPQGMTDANFVPDEGLKDADGSHYLLQGTGDFNSLYVPDSGALGEARVFGYWELGTISGSNSFIGFYDDRNSVPNNQTPWRYTFAASNTAVVGYTGIWSAVDPASRWETAHTTTPGLYTFGFKPATFGRVWRNGVNILNDTTVATQYGSSMRAALMATSFIDFGSSNAGIEPDSVFECLDTRLGCYYSGDADVLGDAELLDLYETTRDYLMIPTGRVSP